MANEGKTEASLKMQDHIGEPLGGDDINVNGVIAESAPADDVFGLTATDRAIFGMRENETHIAIRDPNSEEWKKVDSGRWRQILHKYDGKARVLKDADGNVARPHLPGACDMILVAVDKDTHKAFEKQAAREAQAYMAESDPDNGGHREGSFDRRNRDHIEAAAEETRYRLAQIAQENANVPRRLSQGIVGDTSGLTLAQAMAVIPKAIREEEATRYRQGARYAGLTDEQFFAEAGAAPPKGKAFGVGRGLGNENPNSALAQARNARARESGASQARR